MLVMRAFLSSFPFVFWDSISASSWVLWSSIRVRSDYTFLSVWWVCVVSASIWYVVWVSGEDVIVECVNTFILCAHVPLRHQTVIFLLHAFILFFDLIHLLVNYVVIMVRCRCAEMEILHLGQIWGDVLLVLFRFCKLIAHFGFELVDRLAVVFRLRAQGLRAFVFVCHVCHVCHVCVCV